MEISAAAEDAVATMLKGAAFAKVASGNVCAKSRLKRDVRDLRISAFSEQEDPNIAVLRKKGSR